MIKKGIILAGGNGTRMSPLTKAVNKHLLPIYDKPLIFYPLSLFLLAGIRDILIIVNKDQLDQYKKILKYGDHLGIKISYAKQETPLGLPYAFILGEKFIGNNNVALILGDNFFYGQNLTDQLIEGIKLKVGSKVFLYKVNKPEAYGVAKLNKKNKIIGIKEKPKNFYSDYAITGLYFFDNKVVDFTKKLKFSSRNELEIIDILKMYLKKKQLNAEIIGRGVSWLDAGSIDDYYKATNFVSAIESRQGFKIACLEEISLNNKWINKKDISKSIKFYGDCNYSNYLKKLIK